MRKELSEANASLVTLKQGANENEKSFIEKMVLKAEIEASKKELNELAKDLLAKDDTINDLKTEAKDLEDLLKLCETENQSLQQENETMASRVSHCEALLKASEANLLDATKTDTQQKFQSSQIASEYEQLLAKYNADKVI